MFFIAIVVRFVHLHPCFYLITENSLLIVTAVSDMMANMPWCVKHHVHGHVWGG